MRAGEYVTANSPDIWASEVVGFLFNTTMNGDKLVSEIWLDIEKAEKLGELGTAVVETLRSGGQMEVSTGLLLNVEETAGTWNGESYEGIARMILPDHLALLPNEIGACSWDDGCGTPRVNQKGERMGNDPAKTKHKPLVNELTLDDRASTVRRAFWQRMYQMPMDDPMYADYDVVAVFEASVIAKNWDTKNHVAFSYTISDAGEVAFGEPVPVEVVYRAKDGGAEVVVNQAQTPPMSIFARIRHLLGASNVEGVGVGEQPATNSQEDDAVKKCDMVATLIANERCKIGKEALEQMDEATLTALHEVYAANAAAAPAQTQAAPATNAQGFDVKQLVAETVAATTAAVRAEFAPILQTIQANADRERAELVAEITANSDMGEDDLKPLGVEALRKLASNLMPRDYSGGVGTFRSNTSEDEEYVMEMPSVWPVATRNEEAK